MRALWNSKLRKHFTPTKSSNPLGAGAGAEIGGVFFFIPFFPAQLSLSLFCYFESSFFLFIRTILFIALLPFLPFLYCGLPLPSPIPHSNHIHRLLREIAKVKKKKNKILQPFFFLSLFKYSPPSPNHFPFDLKNGPVIPHPFIHPTTTLRSLYPGSKNTIQSISRSAKPNFGQTLAGR